MNDAATLTLFDDLVVAIGDALDRLDDWGLSGRRAGQYRHDVLVDDLVVPSLSAAGFRVLSEESGLVGSGEVTVVVDPVDGSTNGSLGLPWYATSLCAVDAEGPWVALVANLATGERFRAVRGGGAEVTDERHVPVPGRGDVGVDQRAGAGREVDPA